MRGMLKTLAAMAMMAALAACGDATPTGVDLGAPALSRDATPMTWSVTQDYGNALAPWSMGMTGSADFGGSLQTPTPCYTVRGASVMRGSQIVVTVTAEPTGNICMQVITNNNYTGSVMGLAPGVYGLRVIHDFGGRTTAMDTQVTVR